MLCGERTRAAFFLVHATSERWDRAFHEYLDEEFELHLPPDYPEGELVFRGRDGVDQFALSGSAPESTKHFWFVQSGRSRSLAGTLASHTKVEA
jgi:hypothetical protein